MAAASSAASLASGPGSVTSSGTPTLDAHVLECASVGAFPTTYTVYVLRVTYRADVWILEKRYREFYALHQRVLAEASVDAGSAAALEAAFPAKKVLPDLRVRARALNDYLGLLVSLVGHESEATRQFLYLPTVDGPPPPVMAAAIAGTDSSSGHTNYHIAVRLAQRRGLYYVKRRFREFKALHSALCDNFNRSKLNPFLGAFPEATFFDRMDDAVVAARQRALDEYIRRVALHPMYGRLPEVLLFLCVAEHAEGGRPRGPYLGAHVDVELPHSRTVDI
eukprot:a679670_6.p1 GENE.a679670_6~~a679670_6.p1  ORF type:complete len:299 (-),score=69.55 a679670_6:56-892(-)